MEIFYIFHYVMQMVMLDRMHLVCRVQSLKYKIFIIVFSPRWPLEHTPWRYYNRH